MEQIQYLTLLHDQKFNDTLWFLRQEPLSSKMSYTELHKCGHTKKGGYSKCQRCLQPIPDGFTLEYVGLKSMTDGEISTTYFSSNLSYGKCN